MFIDESIRCNNLQGCSALIIQRMCRTQCSTVQSAVLCTAQLIKCNVSQLLLVLSTIASLQLPSDHLLTLSTVN